MEEYLWEVERDKRQVNKCSPSPVCKINELINKTTPSLSPQTCGLAAGGLPEGIAAAADFCLGTVIG